MSELELRLSTLRDEIAWPETPQLEPKLDRLPRRRSRPRALVLGFAVVLVILAGMLAFSSGARSAFLEIFRIRGATVERVDELSPIDAQRLDYGERVSREEAERRAGFELVDLGEPDGIFVRDRMASLVYGAFSKPRLVLTQLRGDVWDGFVKKVGASGTSVEQVTVNGGRGLFVSGDQHVVMFVGEDGAVTDERTYLAGTVLLWNRGPLLLRLEGDLTREKALELARSID
jgi:hypothetical protein